MLPPDRMTVARVLLAAAYMSPCGCFPNAAMRPPTPMVGGACDEVGIAAVGGAWFQAGSEEVYPGCEGDDCGGPYTDALAEIEGWYYHSFGSWDLGAIAFAGATSVGGGGLLIRSHSEDSSRIRSALEVQLGWLWASIGVPVAVELTSDDWLYFAPRMWTGWSILSAGLPVGVSTKLTSTSALLLEAGVERLGFGAASEDDQEGFRVYLSGGISKRW